MDKEDLQELKSNINNIKTQMSEINVNIAELKVDVRHHIKRTDLHEARLELLQKAMWVCLGALICMEFFLKYINYGQL